VTGKWANYTTDGVLTWLSEVVVASLADF
jgi:hypothetical protein